MTTLHRTTFSLAILLLAAPFALAQGTYTQIDYPGSVWTRAFGIDSAGNIVGTYQDSSGGLHGFLLSSGSYTSIEYPGSSTTWVYGLNDFGQIVGFSGTSNVVGFIYNVAAQTFATITYPGAYATLPTAINNMGKVAGTYFTSNNGEGFEFVSSKYKEIIFPGVSSTVPGGITDSGEVVGHDVLTQGGYGNFAFASGKGKNLVIHAYDATVLGVNNGGTALVGYYSTPTGLTFGFVSQGRTFTKLDFRGSTVTIAQGINFAGEVVGYFFDQSTNQHGRVAQISLARV